MTEVEQMLPMIINNKTDLIIESIILYFQEKWNRDIYERLKSGYSEMSQINLALAELGMEQDMSDLDMYEARLGCEVS
jgi:CopG family transcriptional regulator/antitoxin EndoAI